MNTANFQTYFEAEFPHERRERPTRHYAWRIKYRWPWESIKRSWYVVDRHRKIEGMSSVKNQRLLNLAYAHLPTDEAYLEIGSWQGKSLVAAMDGNQPRPTYACDNFSEFTSSQGMALDIQARLMRNLKRYRVERPVTFYDEPFQQMFATKQFIAPIGVYFYDAAHDADSQYQAIRLVEPCLADEALVIIDDWRHAADSDSWARQGTEHALTESTHDWQLLYELPARFNGDRAMWWNGVAVYAFRRSFDPRWHQATEVTQRQPMDAEKIKAGR